MKEIGGKVEVYCGGVWKGITNNLDYIEGMGFDAIWISPIPTNYPNSYHGYHMTNIETLNSNFGTEQDFIDLVAALHQRDMWIMLDVVGNHVGPVGVDFSQIAPFNSSSHYHPRCQINNFNNQTEVEYCRLADLPDLNQKNSFVEQTLVNWIHQIVSKYDIDGLRIDTVEEVPGKFWVQYQESAGVFATGEIFSSNYGYIGNYQNYIDSTLGYPLFYALRNVFTYQKDMSQLTYHYTLMNQYFRDPSVIANFVDNHDNERFLYQNNNPLLLKSALAYVIGAEGIPITYYVPTQLNPE